MKQDLDEQLCKRYPKIFKDRYGDMKTTAMCWGFQINNGWFNIIDILCANIQNHINHKRKQRLNALRFNRALKRALNGDNSSLIKYHTFKGSITEYGMKYVVKDTASATFRKVPEKVHQVVAEQVKEKFGGLRFYYNGGDDVIDGMVRIAESISTVTCETCGSPGKQRGQGWIYTACDVHAKHD